MANRVQIPTSNSVLIAMIADEDTVVGFLMAGVGNVDLRRKTNYLIVDSKTTVKQIEDTFKEFTTREDIAVVLISQYENKMLKEQLEALIQENTILKRAVAVQHERQKEYENQSPELQHLKQLASQYQEQLRTLEVILKVSRIEEDFRAEDLLHYRLLCCVTVTVALRRHRQSVPSKQILPIPRPDLEVVALLTSGLTASIALEEEVNGIKVLQLETAAGTAIRI